MLGASVLCILKVLSGLLIGLAATGCTPTLRTDGAIAVNFDYGSYETALMAMSDYPAQVQSNGLRPGDFIRVSVAQVPDLTSETRVFPSGEITLPYIGAINVTRRSIGEVQREIEQLYRSQLTDPVVTISVLEFADELPKPKIYMIGNVRRPGAYIYDEPVTVLEALALCGGTELGSDLNAVVTIRREGGILVATIYRTGDILHKGVAKGRINYLMPHDIVFVPRSGLSRVADVMSEVRRVVGLNGLSTNISYRFDELE